MWTVVSNSLDREKAVEENPENFGKGTREHVKKQKSLS